jgi:hypothetical protein
MSRSHRQNWVLRLAGIALFAIGIRVSDRAHASIVIDLPELTFASDDVNPISEMFEVVLSVSGMPVNVSTYNLDFSTTGTGLEFTAVQNAMTMPLFPDTNFDASSSSSTNVLAFNFSDDPMGVPAFDQAGLIKVSFTIAPGTVGAFNLVWNPFFTQLSDGEGNAIDVELRGGSITVGAAGVPEPAAWQIWLLLALVCSAAARLRTRGALCG